MAQVIVRNLEKHIVESLKAKASRHGRSLEAELRVILEKAAAENVIDIVEARARADRIREGLTGPPHSDSAQLIREDRDR